MELDWLKHRDIVWAFYRSANAYALLSRKKVCGGSVKFSPIEIQIIEHILQHSEEHRNMKWYANQIGISTSSFTQYINNLEQNGYIEKYHTVNNKKNVILRVSDAGVKAYREYAKNASIFFDKIFACLDKVSQEDLEYFRKALDIWATGHYVDILNNSEELIRINSDVRT